MREAGGAPPAGRPSDAEDEEVLRAKYLDYCSAQVADFLLLLSPDEIYVLARDAAREVGNVKDLPYDEIVQLATSRISAKLVLPPFDVWVEDYRAHSEYYDRYLMGFWKSEVEPSPEG